MVKVDIIPKSINVVRRKFKAVLTFKAPNGKTMTFKLEDNDDVTLMSAIVYKFGLKHSKQYITNNVESRLLWMIVDHCYPLTTSVCIQHVTHVDGDKYFRLVYYGKDGTEKTLTRIVIKKDYSTIIDHSATLPKVKSYLKRAFLFLKLVGEYP